MNFKVGDCFALLGSQYIACICDNKPDRFGNIKVRWNDMPDQIFEYRPADVLRNVQTGNWMPHKEPNDILKELL